MVVGRALRLGCGWATPLLRESSKSFGWCLNVSVPTVQCVCLVLVGGFFFFLTAVKLSRAVVHEPALPQQCM